MGIVRITKACVRKYRDSGQTKAFVEWIDNKGRSGRTEADCTGKNPWTWHKTHMGQLFARAEREGIKIAHEIF